MPVVRVVVTLTVEWHAMHVLKPLDALEPIIFPGDTPNAGMIFDEKEEDVLLAPR